MNIDGMVRETLHSYADGAPPSDGLLGAAQARARRRRVRHAGVAVAVSTGAILLAASIPFGASGDGPAVPGSGPPPVELAEPSFELPPFPFTPGWLPDGVEAPHVSYYSFEVIEAGIVEGPSGTEGYERSLPTLTLVHPAGRGGLRSPLMVEVYETDPSGYFERSGEHPITVQGRAGARYVGEEGNVSIVWPHEPDLWVRVWADPGIALADVERYAKELDATPLPADAPFTFDLLPEGSQLYRLGTDRMSFTSRDGVMLGVDLAWDEHAVGPILTSPTPTVEPSTEPSPDVSPEPSPGGIPSPSGAPAQVTAIDVNGRPAELIEWSQETSVSIYLDQGWVLSVSGTLNPEDLLRVAEGIDLTPAARPFGIPVNE